LSLEKLKFYKRFINEENMINKCRNHIHPEAVILLFILVAMVACTTSGISENYHDPEMDFSALRTIAVMPFANLTNDKQAGQRVRDTFMTSLMATGVVYVIPAGEINRGILRTKLANPISPSGEDIAKLSSLVKADAVMTGVVREFSVVRSGQASAGVISMSMQMIESNSRKVVWTASTTQGGISTWDRLFGGGGRPMNEITEQAVNDIIKKLFY
jgi:hypothetical protein